MGLLDGKSIIITGAGGGIGRGMSHVFSREGAQLLLVDRDAESLKITGAEVAATGGNVVCFEVDVTNPADCKDMVAECVRTFGKLDGAVNNAGVEGGAEKLADVEESVFDNIQSVNFKGVWNCMRFEIPQMQNNGGGSIVNISSTTTTPTVSRMSAYVASKYGVQALTKSAAYEYAPDGIRVNTILPGGIETPMLAEYLGQNPKLRDAMLKDTPLGRFGRTEEIGEAAAWLCSDRSSYVMGAELTVDGGHALRAGRTAWSD